MSKNEKIILNREEIAKREIGITQISGKLSVFFTIFFLFCIFSYPLLQIGYEYIGLHEKVPQTLKILYPSETTTWKKLLTSNNKFLDYIHSYENTLNDQSLLRKYLLPTVQTFLFRSFHITVENVEVGKDQWFFNKGDLIYLTAPGFLNKKFQKDRIPENNPASPDPVHTILDFNHYLSGSGIQLIILPMPVKGSLYPEKYSSYLSHVDLPLENSSFNQFKDILIQHGVLVFDPGPIFADAKQKGIQPFLRTDTHWKSDGMLLVARELGKFIKSHVALPPQKKGYYTASESQSSTLGDLVGLSKLTHPEHYIALEYIHLRKIYQDGITLSNEHNSDVLLMGDSFLRYILLRQIGGDMMPDSVKIFRMNYNGLSRQSLLTAADLMPSGKIWRISWKKIKIIWREKAGHLGIYQ